MFLGELVRGRLGRYAQDKKSALIWTFALTKVAICVFLLMDFLLQEMNNI